MSKEKFVTGLDIGTSKVKALILHKTSKGQLEVVDKFETRSLGVRKGTIDETGKTSNVVKNLFLRIEKDFNKDIDSVVVNLSGSHLFAKSSHGLVSVSRADNKISKEDVNRVLENAQTLSLSSNDVIFNVRPRKFKVDDMDDIRDPIGLEGVRLEADVLALGGFSPYIKNTEKVLHNVGLEVLEKIPSPIAAARAVLSEKQKRLGCAVLDIGAGITTVAVFKNGHLIYFSVLPIGSNDITSDIAIGLKINPEMAEKIKLEFGSCSLKGKDKKRKVDFGEEEPLEFSQKFLTKIIKSRVSEIFEEINEKMKEKVSKEEIPSGIVLTGGGAKLYGIVKLAKEKFSVYSSLGKFSGPLEAEDDLSLATVYGLALSGLDKLEEEDDDPGFLGSVGSKFKDLFSLFNP
jgi:cell division protein FtsA